MDFRRLAIKLFQKKLPEASLSLPLIYKLSQGRKMKLPIDTVIIMFDNDSPKKFSRFPNSFHGDLFVVRYNSFKSIHWKAK